MIEIEIKTDGKDVLDSLKKADATLSEVGVTLLRLKQIEIQLINMEFDSKLEVEEK